MKNSVPRLYLDLPEVALTVALSESAVQRLVREKGFPQPRELSPRRVGWLYREVEEWAEQRPIADNLPPANTGAKKTKCAAN